uniref:Uncharacterized protein n=1 Tax=Arundo donax TaxID=35708 RepID=A0A0A9HU09_ARUDO
MPAVHLPLKLHLLHGHLLRLRESNSNAEKSRNSSPHGSPNTQRTNSRVCSWILEIQETAGKGG